LSLYDRRDWEEWHAWRHVLEPPKMGQRARAIDIWHPFLVPLKIKSVVIKNVSIPRQTEDGVWQILIPMQAWRRPKITLSKPDGAKATETDPLEIQIAANSEQIKQLNALAESL
jgi:hypothetical protein